MFVPFVTPTPNTHHTHPPHTPHTTHHTPHHTQVSMTTAPTAPPCGPLALTPHTGDTPLSACSIGTATNSTCGKMKGLSLGNSTCLTMSMYGSVVIRHWWWSRAGWGMSLAFPSIRLRCTPTPICVRCKTHLSGYDRGGGRGVFWCTYACNQQEYVDACNHHIHHNHTTITPQSQYCITPETTSIPWPENDWEPMIFIDDAKLHYMVYFEATLEVCVGMRVCVECVCV